MDRPFRRYLVVVLVALTVVLAGCGGSGTATPAAGDGDGASDGDGSGDSAGDGGDADGSDGPDAGETPAATPESSDTATPAAGATATGTPSPTPTPNASGSVGPRFGDLYSTPESYRYRMDVDRIEGRDVEYVQEGRWREGNHYGRLENQQGTIEVYEVDGTVDAVLNGQCVDMDTGSTQTQDPNNVTREEYYNLSARPTGTDTVDGEDVYVYEMDIDQPGVEGPFTYYVDTESGYVRKTESQGTTATFWDFSAVDPIESPC